MKASIEYNRNSPIVAKYKKLAKTMKDNIQDEMVIATEHVIDALSDNAPIDTGDLSRSFDKRYYWDDNVFHSYVYSTSYYLQFLIMGTGKYNRTGNGRKTPWTYFNDDPRSKYYGWHTTEGMQPNPFIKNTFSNEREMIRQGIREALRRSLKDY